MNEGILLGAILIVAVVFTIRPWYRAFTGKGHGCVGCSGTCGQSCSCSHTHDGQEKGAEVGTSPQDNTDQNKGL